MNYQKFLYNRMGQKVPDIWSANNKIASNWYYYFTTQAVQYLLGNGVTFKSKKTTETLFTASMQKGTQKIMGNPPRRLYMLR